jgi:DNA-binding CsgD family transcriptional regulator/tetratricopeptide (TPR) repeat protein
VVRALLHRASQRSTILVVLEDLHWADESSLVLLEFLAQDVGAHPLLVLATYRDGEVTASLAKTLGELARLGVQRIALSGLPPKGTGRLMARVAGRRPTSHMVQQVQARTDGNPFFVAEIARLDTYDVLAIPDNVRVAISRRLDRLPTLAVQALVVAAVIGREFDFPLLRASLRNVSEDRLLRAIDEGLQTLLIEPLPARGEEWYQFRHVLIRDALYESLSASRRTKWHAAIARALGTLVRDRVDGRIAELAQHAASAGTRIEPTILAKYARLAGERFLAAHAFEEALVQFQRAWEARKALPLDAAAAATLVGLGCARAAIAVRWNRQQEWGMLRRAVEFYLRAGNIPHAIAIATDPRITVEGTTGVVAALQQIREVAPVESTEHGWLLARLGAATYFETGDYHAAQTVFAQARAAAAVEGEAGLELRMLAYETSVDHFDLRWPEVLVKSRRARDLAQRVDDLQSETYARYRAAYALMMTGRTDEAVPESEAHLAAAEQLRDRGLLADALYVKSALAQLRGEWGEARAYSDRALAQSAHQLPSLHTRVLLEYETGNHEAGEQFLRRLLAAERRAGPYPLAGIYEALAHSQLSRLGSGRATLDAALRAARAVLERQPPFPLAQTTARVSRGLAAILRSRADECDEELHFLEPYAGKILAPFLVIDRLLGLLAKGAHQRRRALAHFERALAFCRGSGYLPELAWTCFDYAHVLLDGCRRDERARAAALLDESEGLSARLGMRPLADAVAAFRRRHGLRLDRKPAGLTDREMEILGLLSLGRTNKEIADALCISSNTVAVHVARVLTKTGSSNRTEAASYAVRHHLLGETRVVPCS